MQFRFHDCVLDADARRLSRAGRDVHLGPKAFELLKVLIESRPRVLSKCQLLERVWPGVFVSDASLAKVVSKIRSAIGECDDTPPIIRTVHGFGYAFVAPIADERGGNESAQPLPHAICWFFCGTREFPLPDGEHIVGREPDASVWLDSPRVSRRHARVVVRGSIAQVEDLGSKNGSFVGDARIEARTELRPNDVVRIGPFRLVFRVAADSGSTQSEAGFTR